MFRKIKGNQYVKLVCGLLQNPRTKSMIILVFWAFFFLFIFLVFDVRGEKNYPVYTATDKWEKSNNYEYQVIFTINHDAHIVNGIRSDSYETFSLEGQNYYLEKDQLFLFFNDQKVPQDNTELLNYDFLKLRPAFLGKVLSNGTLEYTTNYQSGTIKKGYSIPASSFVTKEDKSLESVSMEVVETNGIITEINLDLKALQPDYEQYKINISYSNIGNFSNLELE